MDFLVVWFSFLQRPIDPYEFKNVGIIDPTNPLAPPPIQILGLDSLIGQSFFELHTDQLLVDEDGNTNVIVEFYAGVDRDNPTMDCSIDGTLIASDKVQYTSDIISLGRFGYNDQFKPKNSNECFPRTKTGVVGETFHHIVLLLCCVEWIYIYIYIYIYEKLVYDINLIRIFKLLLQTM